MIKDKISGLMQDAKKRNLIIVLGIVFVFILIIVFYRMGDTHGVDGGSAKIPRTPDVSGMPDSGKMSKEYLKTLLKSDESKAQTALKSGGSAVPTFIRGGSTGDSGEDLNSGAKQTTCTSCCNQCCNKNAPGTSSLLTSWAQNGQVSPLAAAVLGKLADQGVSVDDYADELNRLVKEGKITPEQAKQLLEAYKKEHGAAVQSSADDVVDGLLTSGNISPKTADAIKKLNASGMSQDEYAAAIRKLIRDGKLSLEQAKRLIDAYALAHLPLTDKTGKVGRASALTPGTILNALAATGSISPSSAAEIDDLNNSKKTAADYAKSSNQLVQDGKLSPKAAKQLLDAYISTNGEDYGLPTTNSAMMDKYKRDQAAAALAQERAKLNKAERDMDAKQVGQTGQYGQLGQKQTGSANAANQDQQTISAIQNAMNTQASALYQSWNPTPQVYVASKTKEGEGQGEDGDKGIFAKPISQSDGFIKGKGRKNHSTRNIEQNNSENVSDNSDDQIKQGFDTTLGNANLAKAGDITFAVLETEVNSDEPGPVMATIVSGKLKGSRLLGQLSVSKDEERIIIQFSTLSVPTLTDTVPITAYAVDPDTARTALASDVNHHYFTRFGSMFASSFLSGYAKAITNAGTATQSQTSPDVQTVTHPPLSSTEKLLVATGEVGTQLSNSAKKEFDTKPTVKVHSGVGIGVLFMNDVKNTNK